MSRSWKVFLARFDSQLEFTLTESDKPDAIAEYMKEWCVNGFHPCTFLVTAFIDGEPVKVKGIVKYHHGFIPKSEMAMDMILGAIMYFD